MTDPSNRQSASFATTRILAIGMLAQGVGQESVTPVMPAEVRATVALYLDGTIDQWFAQHGGGVLFLLNLQDIDEARKRLGGLPLASAGLMTFTLTALGPLVPLHALLQS